MSKFFYRQDRDKAVKEMAANLVKALEQEIEFDKTIEKACGKPEHSAKFKRCVQHVKAKGGKYDPYAVCTVTVGKSDVNDDNLLQKADEVVSEMEKKVDASADLNKADTDILGHARSGKKIHMSPDHSEHKDFSAGDHLDAMAFHSNKKRHHLYRAIEQKDKKDRDEELAKADKHEAGRKHHLDQIDKKGGWSNEALTYEWWKARRHANGYLDLVEQ